MLDGGITVAALVVAELRRLAGRSRRPASCGAPATACRGEFAALRRPSRAELRAFRALPWPPRPAQPTNTTLAVVATDADLTKAELLRVAGAGHDGMARAINPIHTYTDGDVVFAIATHEAPVPEAPSDGFIQPDRRPLHPARPVIIAAPPTASPGPSSTPSCNATSAGTMRSYADQLPSAIRR